MTNKFIYLIPLFALLYLAHDTIWEIGYGYEVKLGRYDDWKIERHGEVIVGPTIHDYQKIGDFVIGIHTPVHDKICGKFPYAIAEKKKGYFVLQIDTGKVLEFYDPTEFSTKLSELNIQQSKVDLHYGLLDDVWDPNSVHYGNFFTEDFCESQKDA
ncbi:hypothetical protein FNC98_02515 [Thalassotalea sp. PS06]|nr:hypothetical protein FNC98_02515 [Thalassotalea sp. PS06]